MNWESQSPYYIGDEAHPLSFRGIGGALCLLSAIIGGKSGSNRDHIGRGEKSLGLERHYLAVRDGASLPISRLRTGRARGGVATAGHCGMDLCRMRSDEYSRRGEGVVWI